MAGLYRGARWGDGARFDEVTPGVHAEPRVNGSIFRLTPDTLHLGAQLGVLDWLGDVLLG